MIFLHKKWPVKGQYEQIVHSMKPWLRYDNAQSKIDMAVQRIYTVSNKHSECNTAIMQRKSHRLSVKD